MLSSTHQGHHSLKRLAAARSFPHAGGSFQTPARYPPSIGSSVSTQLPTHLNFINGHNSTSYRLLTSTPTLVLLFDVALELASSVHELHRTLTTSSQNTLYRSNYSFAEQHTRLGPTDRPGTYKGSIQHPIAAVPPVSSNARGWFSICICISTVVTFRWYMNFTQPLNHICIVLHELYELSTTVTYPYGHNRPGATATLLAPWRRHTPTQPYHV